MVQAEGRTNNWTIHHHRPSCICCWVWSLSLDINEVQHCAGLRQPHPFNKYCKRVLFCMLHPRAYPPPKKQRQAHVTLGGCFIIILSLCPNQCPRGLQYGFIALSGGDILVSLPDCLPVWEKIGLLLDYEIDCSGGKETYLFLWLKNL